MPYVYILQSKNNGHYYVGSTTDIQRRYKEHQLGRHPSSKRLHNPKLVFKQEFASIELARRIERRLKSYKRRDFIEKIIRDGVIRSLGPIAQLVRAGDS